jgi:hypothetical protein
MKNRKSLLQSAILFVTVILSFYGIHAYGSGKDLQAPEHARADLVFIDSMKQFGPLERPVVTFPHDLHTAALKKQEKDCSVCHLSDNNRMSLKFKHTKNIQKKDLMNLFHSDCIGCHKEAAAARLKTGPVECGECHRKKIVLSSRKPVRFDKSLHYRHSKAQDNKCEACHHEYNENTKKLVYAKGKEGSCRYCHLENTEKNVQSISTASHVACIDCHRKTAEKNKKTGPVTCYGCHDEADQKKYEIISEVPRFDRKQPDQVFIKKGKMDKDGRMSRVPFDHQAHEKYNDTCIQCHHKDLNACSSCHTLKGTKEGGWIKLEQAMHQLVDQSSCQGCHRIRQQTTECAGCHTFAGKIRTPDNTSCQTCHQQPLSDINENDQAVFSDQAAANLLAKRVAITKTYADKDIPDKVMISQLSDQYKPVEMPHRKMVQSLMDGVKNDKLAGYFHKNEGTICQGCHHNSPVSLKPPKCGSCHGKKTIENKLMFRPGLMGAYHLQCMECHQNMELKKLSGCIQCHEKK